MTPHQRVSPLPAYLIRMILAWAISVHTLIYQHCSINAHRQKCILKIWLISMCDVQKGWTFLTCNFNSKGRVGNGLDKSLKHKRLIWMSLNTIIFHFRREPRRAWWKEWGDRTPQLGKIDAYLMAGQHQPGVRSRVNHCIIDNRMDTESKRCSGALIKELCKASAPVNLLTQA